MTVRAATRYERSISEARTRPLLMQALLLEYQALALETRDEFQAAIQKVV